MNRASNINEYLYWLKTSPRLDCQVVYHTVQSIRPPVWSEAEKPWPEIIQRVMHANGIQHLYLHQAKAIDAIRSRKHVVVATPTASGKTLIYNLPVLEKIWGNAGSKALYLFPLKALAQDQLRTFKEMVAAWDGILPTAAIYDGDTTAWHRKRIRERPPNIILTNPEMLHLSFLPHHQTWAHFLSDLEVVVVDEVHTYRGIMGSHMAQVFRRFQRVCSYHGASPVFIFSSATIANPAQLSNQLTGLTVTSISKNGAPRGRRHILFLDPMEGPAQTAILLLKAALNRGLRTIVYTQSRKLTELIAIWAGNQSGRFANRISAYRAGFLPEERREIEARLATGDLLAVISTSALELGIDIGDLDLCILVGYPGSVIATRQRGGRVGRSGQDSALILIAGEDALDQYFMRNPEDFIRRKPEAAVVNPYNSEILAKHLTCASAELPLKVDEPMMSATPVQQAVLRLEEQGALLRSADGEEMYSKEKRPHRWIDLRGTGSRFHIVSKWTGESIGEIDAFRAFKETHPGAVYLHQGDTYLVEQLDLDTRTALVSKQSLDYYTKVRGHKDTEILEQCQKKTVWGTAVFFGRLKVTDQVTGYERWRIHAKKRLNIVSLDLPPQLFETEGLWYQIPLGVQREAESKYMHFMGGIHAIEHAAIGIFPLLVMTDRNDLGGIATPYHFQVGRAAIFVYDGVPGGAGLCRLAFERAEALLAYTLKAIDTCPCESGCPSCVHSPKCGSGNRPIDKSCAHFLLDRIKTHPKAEQKKYFELAMNERDRLKKKEKPRDKIYYGVFDIETQRSAQEVGGWHRADRMGISCAVLYDSKKDAFFEFLEDQIPIFIRHLQKFDLVIGFNIKRFDYRVLTGYTDFEFQNLPTLDILEEVYNRLGFRLSLDHLASVTLGKQKSADGLQALQWWKEGRIREIIDYCKMDVAITRDLLMFGKQKGYLLFNNKAGKTVRIPVNWQMLGTKG